MHADNVGHRVAALNAEPGRQGRHGDRQDYNDGSQASVTGLRFLDRFSIRFVEAHYAVHPDPCGGRRFRG